jgi:PKD repeat protein
VSRRPFAFAALGTALALTAGTLTAQAQTTTAPQVITYAGKAAPSALHTLARAVSPQTTNGLTASFTPSETGARSFSFNATSSTDTESTITGYTLSFGDGTAAISNTTGTFTYTYARAGSYTVTLTVTDAAGTTDSATQTVTTLGSDYTPYGPLRLLDTRNGTGEGGTAAKISADSAIKLQIGGNGDIPTGVTAVVLNLTATDNTAIGDIVAYADGTTKPATSNLNFASGQTIASTATVAVGADGSIDLYNGSSASTDLIADISGYYTQTSASGFTPLTPDRILDTRTTTGGHDSALGSDTALTLTVAGADGGLLPSSGITAVALNLTVTNESANGDIVAYPEGATKPGTSNINYFSGVNIANYAIVPVAANGEIEIYNNSTGTTNVIADVSGYFSATGTSSFVPVTPTRTLDTRTLIDGTVEPDTIAQDTVLTSSSNNATAYAITATVTNTAANGALTIYPASSSVPTVSNINWSTGDTIANAAYVTPGATGIYFYNNSDGDANFLADEYGYFSNI